MLDVFGLTAAAGAVGMVLTAIALAWGTVPALIAALVKKWEERGKALVVWTLISAIFFTFLTAVLTGVSLTLIGVFVGLLVYYLIAGAVVMILAAFIGLPVASYLEKKGLFGFLR